MPHTVEYHAVNWDCMVDGNDVALPAWMGGEANRRERPLQRIRAGNDRCAHGVRADPAGAKIVQPLTHQAPEPNPKKTKESKARLVLSFKLKGN